MISVPFDLQSLIGVGLWQAFVVFVRVSALVSVVPAFGERTLPVRVKLGVAVAFSIVVATTVQPVFVPTDISWLLKTVVAEIVIGLSLGLGVRLFVLALQTAGSIAAQSTSLSQILGGAAAEPMPAMGYILVVGGLALAAMSGLHVHIAVLLTKTYDLFPVGIFPGGRDLSLWGVTRVAKAFSLAFTLAAPFVIASVLYNLTLGVINRAMPQLMVAFVGAPVITLGGLLLLLVCTPMLLTIWYEGMSAFLQNPIEPQNE